MTKIRFKAQGANSMIGSFSSGDIANVSEAFAKHLVEEAQVAEYVKVGEPAKPKKAAKAKAKPAKAPADSAADEPADDPADPPAPTIQE